MNSDLLQTLARFDKGFVLVLKWLCIALFSVITVIMTLKIVVRYYPFMSMHVFDDILDLLYSSLIFYGALAVWIAHGHFRIGDWISKLLPQMELRLIYRTIVELLSLIFIAVFFWYSLQFTREADGFMDILPYPKWWMYVCMPISAGLMLLYSIKNMVVELVCIVHPEKASAVPTENLNH